jgi:hypothetical protein
MNEVTLAAWVLYPCRKLFFKVKADPSVKRASAF